VATTIGKAVFDTGDTIEFGNLTEFFDKHDDLVDRVCLTRPAPQIIEFSYDTKKAD
jgi:hypothetical protein